MCFGVFKITFILGVALKFNAKAQMIILKNVNSIKTGWDFRKENTCSSEVPPLDSSVKYKDHKYVGLIYRQ